MQIVFPYYVVDKRGQRVTYFNPLPDVVALLSNGSKKIWRFLSARVELQYFPMGRDERQHHQELLIAKQVARRCIVHLFIGEKNRNGWHRRREGSSNSWQLIRLSLNGSSVSACPLLPLSNCYFTFFLPPFRFIVKSIFTPSSF